MVNSRGFTLVELIGVMVIVSIGFVGLAGMFSNLEYTLTSTAAQQKTAQYAQACADYILKIKRDNGFTSSLLVSTMCNSLRTTADVNAGYTITPSFGATYPSSGICPTGTDITSCKDVTITASGGGMTSSVTVTLLSY